MDKNTQTEAAQFKSVWDAITDTLAEAVNLHVRSAPMDKITALIEAIGWTQATTPPHSHALEGVLDFVFMDFARRG